MEMLIVLYLITPVVGGVLFAIWLFSLLGAAQRQLQAQLSFLERALAEVSRSGSGSIDPVLHSQILTALAQMQLHHGQLSGLARERYDVRVGEIMGMAASAGIDLR